jgi:amino acid transporter
MVPVLVGYFLLRNDRPDVRRPFRLPEWMKYVALILAAFFLVIYFYGGPVYASCKCSQAGKSTLPYYFMGFAVLAMYLPFYWYRHKIEDKRDGTGAFATDAVPSAPSGATMVAATEVTS